MSALAANEREALRLDLRKILGFTQVGPVRYQNLLLTQRRVVEWQSERLPAPAEERGGSSSPREVTERVEDRQVAAQAARDAEALTRLIPAWQAELILAGYDHAPSRELAQVSRDLARIVARCVAPVDASRLPKEPVQDGCRSCDRLNTWKGWKGQRVWEPVSAQARYASLGLCSWCGKHGEPDIEHVAMRHRRGEHVAGRALARQQEPRRPKVCGHPTFIDGQPGSCGLEFMHSGQCTPAPIEAVVG